MRVAYKCIKKVKGKLNKIESYELIDELNNTYVYDTDTLRELIHSGRIDVLNLKLSKAGAIINKKFEDTNKLFDTDSKFQLSKTVIDKISNEIDLTNKVIKFKSVKILDNYILKCDYNNYTIKKLYKNLYAVLNKSNTVNIVTDKPFEISGKNGEYLFYCCKAKEINLEEVVTKRMTSMNYMFSHAMISDINLKSLSLNNVTSMDYTFENCKNIESIDMSLINLQALRSLNNTFSNSAIKKVNMCNTYSVNLESMNSTFENCKDLREVDFENFATYSVKSFKYTFCGCISLRELDLTSFTTLSLETVNHMFSGCTMLTSIKLDNFTTTKVGNFNAMFENCSNLIDVKLDHFDFSGTEKIPKAMFRNCLKLYTYLETSKNKTVREMAPQASKVSF